MPSPRIRKMSLSRALDKYLKTVSVHKKGHQQEFYRSNVIKRYPHCPSEYGRNNNR